MGVGLELAARGLQDSRVTMPGVQYADAAGKVDISLAFGIPQLRAPGALGEDRKRCGHSTRHGALAALQELIVCRDRSLLSRGRACWMPAPVSAALMQTEW
jgi:hypothetical protein